MSAEGELNAQMVLSDWAVAYREFSTDYVSDENSAQTGKRGLCRNPPRKSTGRNK